MVVEKNAAKTVKVCAEEEISHATLYIFFRFLYVSAFVFIVFCVSLCIFSTFSNFYCFCSFLFSVLRAYIFCLNCTESTTNKKAADRSKNEYKLFSEISLAAKYAATTDIICMKKESAHIALYPFFRLSFVFALVSIVYCVFLCLQIVYRLFASKAGIALRNFVQFLQFLP